MAFVTLTGEVNSQARRAHVEKIASGVPNVQQVVNELQIKNQKATRHSEICARCIRWCWELFWWQLVLSILRGPSPTFRVWQKPLDVSMVRHRFRARAILTMVLLTRLLWGGKIYMDQSVITNDSNASGVSWAAVIAGAFVAAALSLILLALGTGIGFSHVVTVVEHGRVPLRRSAQGL